MKTFAQALEDPAIATAVVELLEKAIGRRDFDIVLIVHSAEGQSMVNNVLNRDELALILEGAAEKVRMTNPDTVIRPAAKH